MEIVSDGATRDLTALTCSRPVCNREDDQVRSQGWRAGLHAQKGSIIGDLMPSRHGYPRVGISSQRAVSFWHDPTHNRLYPSVFMRDDLWPDLLLILEERSLYLLYITDSPEPGCS